MCLGRRPSATNYLPKQPVDSAIEETADSVKVAGNDQPRKRKKELGLTTGW